MKYYSYLLIGLFFLLFIVSLNTGASDVSIFDFFVRNLTPTDKMILFDLRLSRTLVCIFVGASLALSGLLLQSFLKNPLAEPYTLGLSGGSSLGSILFLSRGWQFLFFGSFVGCWLVTFLILQFRKIFTFRQKHSLILLGVMISFLCGAIVTLTVSFMEPQRLQTALFWMIGQCGTERDQYWYLSCLAFLFCLFWGLRSAKKLDMFLIDEKTVKSFHPNQKNLERNLILVVALLTSISVSICGLIGFVGLLSPHICRLILKTSRHKMNLLLSSLLGALFLLSADILGRIIGGTLDIPTGSITAIIGSPFFIFLLFRRYKYAS